MRQHSWHAFMRVVRGSTLVAALFTSLAITHPAQAQTFTILHNFTGGPDGGEPIGGLTIDARGNLYGTANIGGQGTCPPLDAGCGTVYKLSHAGSGWIFTLIYKFSGEPDGSAPYGGVVFGPDGALYGSTMGGGSDACQNGCGTVYRLRPQPTQCISALCPWRETVLYRFSGGSDAYDPTGDLTFDSSGKIYGTTYLGGISDMGTVWKLTPSGLSWDESLAYSFTGSGSDGGNPYGGVVFDNAGNMYVSASAGTASGLGAAIELSPSGSHWTETSLHDFEGGEDGGFPVAGLIDASGTLYGVTIIGPTSGATAYEFTPAGGGWSFATISNLPPGYGPFGHLTADAAGNLYGMTQGGSVDKGTVFKLTPSGGGWTLTVLHIFSGGTDGETPFGSVVVDSSGNVYGTTLLGGTANRGVVFEITP